MTFTATHEATADPSHIPSEAETLAAEARAARAAMAECASRMKGSLRNTASLSAWVRQHPWWATGAAVATGVLAGRVVGSLLPACTNGDESQTSPAAEAEASRLLTSVREVFEQSAKAFLANALAKHAHQNGEVAGGENAADENAAEDDLAAEDALR